jgi:hypothetical protein
MNKNLIKLICAGGSALLIFGITSCSSGTKNDANQEVSEVDTSAARVYKLGEEIEYFDVTFTVEESSDWNKSDPGFLRRFMVKACVKGNEATTFSAINWNATSAAGSQFTVSTFWDPAPEWLKPKFPDYSIPIQPGNCLRGLIAFETSEEISQVVYANRGDPSSSSFSVEIR